LATERLIPILINDTVIALTLLCMFSDYRRRIIPNFLTLPAMALGLILNLVGLGWYHGLLFSIPGLLAGIGLLLLPFEFGQMGGGDVKLMGALGAFLGAYAILNVFLYTTLAGGVFALGAAVYKKSFVATIKKVGLLAKCMVLFRAPAAGTALFKDSIPIPYGLAIGAGTFCYLIFGKIV
jgi:prepilin peptidase CpaA